MKFYFQPIGYVAFAASLLGGCASTGPSNPVDPYENYNRTIYQVNDTFYKYVGTPINVTYKTVTPEVLRTGIGNVLSNVGTIPSMANDALQFNWRYLGKDTLRFVLNTTLGFFGLIDVAGMSGIPAHQQSFSYTLAKWGWVNSNYFMIPLLGPGTVSSAVSLPFNYFMSPMTYAVTNNWSWGLWGMTGVQKIYEILPSYNTINDTAVDPYIAIRNAFEQNRAFVIQQIQNDGVTPAATDSTDLSPVLMELNQGAGLPTADNSQSQISPLLRQQMSSS